MASPLMLITTVNTCDGRQRDKRFWGTGVVDGVTQIDGVPAPCRVTIFNTDGMSVGFRRTGTDGVYVFNGLASGTYRLVVEDDKSFTKNPKILYVTIV